MFQLENFRGIVCHDTEKCCKIKGKLTCGLKNDIRNLVNIHASRQNAKFEEKLTLGSKYNRNLVNFNASSGKSENLHSDVLLLLITFVNSI